MTSFGQMKLAKRKAGTNQDGTDKWEEVRVIRRANHEDDAMAGG